MTPNPAAAAPRVPMFAEVTDRFMIPLDTASYVQNGHTDLRLPPMGFIAAIGGILTITFTTAATGTYANKTTRGKVTGNPTPFDAVRRMALSNNQSANVNDLSFWGWYLFSRNLGSGIDWRNPVTGSDGDTTAIYSVPSSYTTATQYTIRVPFYIPVALGPGWQSGLILAQNAAMQYTLGIDWGNIESDLLTLGGTTPSITVNSATISAYVEYASIPPDVRSWPDLGYVHQLTETVYDITGVGDFTMNVVPGPVIAGWMLEYVNNTAGMDCATLTNFQLVVQVSNYLRRMTSRQHRLEEALRLGGGRPLPLGVFWHDLRDVASGVPNIASRRDLLDTSQYTDVRMIGTIASGTSLSGAYLRAITEQLIPSAA